MSLLDLLEWVLVIGILCGIVFAIVQAVPMPAPWPQVAWGVLAIIIVILVFSIIGGLLPPLRLR